MLLIIYAMLIAAADAITLCALMLMPIPARARDMRDMLLIDADALRRLLRVFADAEYGRNGGTVTTAVICFT